MNNNVLKEVFGHGKAFIPFITAGDFGLEMTEKLLFVAQEEGADLVEVGIPFSDPTAEGPVIQEASERALKLGTTPDKIMGMIKGARKKGLKVPLAFMTYANPVFNYGIEKFAKKCTECEICAVIIPEIPYEEKHEMSDIFEENGVSMISLVAPTSHERIKKIVSEAEGFIYCVSSMGVTGMRKNISMEIVREMIEEIKGVKEIACAVGFGISKPEQAKEICRYADGVIVGSAIMDILGKRGEKSVEYVREYIRSMKECIL
jgi:tryptophan synthase alpha chain